MPPNAATPSSWIGPGKSAISVHGASDGETLGFAVAVAFFTALPLCSDSGEYLPVIFCSGAPPCASSTLPPGTSPTVTVAGEPPVFLTVTTWLAVPSQFTVLAMLVGVTVMRPALRLNVSFLVLFAVTVVLVVFDV